MANQSVKLPASKNGRLVLHNYYDEEQRGEVIVGMVHKLQ